MHQAAKATILHSANPHPALAQDLNPTLGPTVVYRADYDSLRALLERSEFDTSAPFFKTYKHLPRQKSHSELL